METAAKTTSLRANLLTIAISLAIGLILIEAVLRSYPSLITVPVLQRFNSALRHSVAERLQLSTKSSRRMIPSAERKDGGPDFYTFEPNRTLNVPVDPVDAKLGAVVEVDVDRNGFCNPAGAAEHKQLDVLILGDSMTFCTAIRPSDTSSAQLERMTNLKTYNLGIPGIGPFEYVELLQKYGIARKPKFVVMNIYEGNDLRDVDRYYNFINAIGGPFAWSYALAFVKAGIELGWRKLDRNTGINFRYSISTPNGRVRMNVTNQDRDEVHYARRLEAGSISLELVRPALDDFLRLARENDFVPLIFLIPGTYTAYARGIVFDDPELEKTMREGGERQRKWLKEYAESRHVMFLDLAPIFQEAGEKESLSYFPANVHLTPHGQHIVASTIATTIRP
jgi:hypothetical protein